MKTYNTQSIETLLAFDAVGGLSTLKTKTSLVSSGTVTSSNSQIVLSTGTNNGAIAQLSTLRRANAMPACDIYTQLGLRTVPAKPIDSQVALWGLYDDNEGYGFGLDATDFFIFFKTGGVINKAYRTFWNIDKLDGKGPSQLTMTDVTAGLFFVVRSTWYGGIEWGIARPDAGIEQANMHHVKLQQPMYLSPYLPLRAEVQNNSTVGTNFQLVVSTGRVSQIASGQIPSRSVSHSNLSLSCPEATDTPIISLVQNTGSTIPVIVDSMEIITDQPLVISGVFGGNLTSTTLTNPSGVPSGESVCQVDTFHPQSPYTVVYQTIVPAGFTVHEFDQKLPSPSSTSPLTLYARPIGATNTTASFNLRWREQW